jgi:hypothetical protein
MSDNFICKPDLDRAKLTKKRKGRLFSLINCGVLLERKDTTEESRTESVANSE